MSWLDELADPASLQNQGDNLEAAPMPDKGPGFFQGAFGYNVRDSGIPTFGAIDEGLTKGILKVGDTLGQGPGRARFGIDEAPSIDDFKNRKLESRQQYTQIIKSLTPDPKSVGLAGQVLNSLADVIPRTAAGALAGGPIGAALLAGVPEFTTSKTLAEADGIDSSTASTKGLIDAAVMGAGALLPAAGIFRNVAGDLAATVGVNVLLGVGQRGGTSLLLEENGYTTQAAQYQAFHTTSLIIDGVLGAAFFGVARMGGANGRAELPPEIVDAALVENQNNNAQLSGPGIPATPQTTNAHQQSLSQALEQVVNGEPVTITTDMSRAEFLRLPRGVRNNNPGNIRADGTPWQGLVPGSDPSFATFDSPESGIRALAKNLLTYQDKHGLNTVMGIIDRWAPPGENNTQAYINAVSKEMGVSPSDNLNLRDPDTLTKLTKAIIRHENGRNPYHTATVARGVERALSNIGKQLTDKIQSDPKAALAEYAAQEGTAGGRILNTDEARELSEHYRADRSRSAEVHEAASQFIKDLYAEKLAQPTPDGRLPLVLFTAGGTGAGKSTSLKTTEGKTLFEAAEIIYDTNMNRLDSAVTKIEQALAAGRDVAIQYTYRDPVDAMVNGSLPRAMRMGRTVPLDAHIDTHVGASAVMRQLAEKYADDPRVHITAEDNSHGKNNNRPANLDELPKVEENGLKERLNEALESEYEAGNISETVYTGSKEQYPELPGSRREAGGRSSQQPEKQHPEFLSQDSASRGAHSPESNTTPAPNSSIEDVTSTPGFMQRVIDSLTKFVAPRTDTGTVPQDSVSAFTPDTGGLGGVEMQAALKAIEADPSMRVTLDDGREVSALEALEIARNEITQAQNDSRAYDAAVTCLLRTS